MCYAVAGRVVRDRRGGGAMREVGRVVWGVFQVLERFWGCEVGVSGVVLDVFGVLKRYSRNEVGVSGVV